MILDTSPNLRTKTIFPTPLFLEGLQLTQGAATHVHTPWTCQGNWREAAGRVSAVLCNQHHLSPHELLWEPSGHEPCIDCSPCFTVCEQQPWLSSVTTELPPVQPIESAREEEIRLRRAWLIQGYVDSKWQNQHWNESSVGINSPWGLESGRDWTGRKETRAIGWRKTPRFTMQGWLCPGKWHLILMRSQLWCVCLAQTNPSLL